MANPVREKKIPIEWHVPEDITSQYANNIVVQHTNSEFFVSFFETLPPLIIGSPEDTRAQIDEVKEVQAKCLARIVIAPNKMKDFIQALNVNFAKFLSKNGMEEEE